MSPCYSSIYAGDSVDEVYGFLKENAVNRTVTTKSSGTLAGGAVEYEFRRDTTLCNLQRISDGFSFDVILLIKQRNWDVKGEKRSGEPRIEDRMLVQRCTIGKQSSSGELLGYARSLTSTHDSWANTIDHLSMRMNGETLHVLRDTGKYKDFFDADGDFYPGAVVRKQEWEVQDDRLLINTTSTTYKADPATGERTPIHVDRKHAPDIESARLGE